MSTGLWRAEHLAMTGETRKAGPNFVGNALEYVHFEDVEGYRKILLKLSGHGI